MNAVSEIQKILEAIDPGDKNRAGNVFINSIKNEFITFQGRMTIPKIPVKELDYETALEIVRDVVRYFPEFFRDHMLLEKRKPAADVHGLHFIKPLKGRLIDFTHFLKLDTRFGGDSSNVIEKGDTTMYPSYSTNRIYYKSRLVPCAEHCGTDFTPLRLFESQQVESDQYFHTFAIFDDVNSRKITKEMLERLGMDDVFTVSRELYPFPVYDFFTACFNVPCPTEEHLKRALELFEPLFIIFFSRYRPLKDLAEEGAISSIFPGEIRITDGSAFPTPEYAGRLRDYFSGYSLIRDDELALKGWWKMEISSAPDKQGT